jgi:ERCC4-type nuclease
MIIIDTREQLPLYKSNYIRRKLCVGDYSHTDIEHCFSIERKSPQDLYGTLLRGHIRFRKEIIRAGHHGITLVVFVETTLKKFIALQWQGGNYRTCSGETLQKIITTMSRKYNLEFVWCANRTVMCKKVKERLSFEISKLTSITARSNSPLPKKLNKRL